MIPIARRASAVRRGEDTQNLYAPEIDLRIIWLVPQLRPETNNPRTINMITVQFKRGRNTQSKTARATIHNHSGILAKAGALPFDNSLLNVNSLSNPTAARRHRIFASPSGEFSEAASKSKAVEVPEILRA
jgi:hypothetical protein